MKSSACGKSSGAAVPIDGTTDSSAAGFAAEATMAATAATPVVTANSGPVGGTTNPVAAASSRTQAGTTAATPVRVDPAHCVPSALAMAKGSHELWAAARGQLRTSISSPRVRLAKPLRSSAMMLDPAVLIDAAHHLVHQTPALTAMLSAVPTFPLDAMGTMGLDAALKRGDDIVGAMGTSAFEMFEKDAGVATARARWASAITVKVELKEVGTNTDLAIKICAPRLLNIGGSDFAVQDHEYANEHEEGAQLISNVSLISLTYKPTSKLGTLSLPPGKKLADPTTFNFEKIDHKGKDVEFIFTCFKPRIRRAISE
ncbi:hypothetical protein T492DRAFT_866498 [Pavlovales sp. CCMP2436]|nr:hypothetical protein T492DRAFT_866498 [Pavlovales sp. CCMP2436]